MKKMNPAERIKMRKRCKAFGREIADRMFKFAETQRDNYSDEYPVDIRVEIVITMPMKELIYTIAIPGGCDKKPPCPYCGGAGDEQ